MGTNTKANKRLVGILTPIALVMSLFLVLLSLVNITRFGEWCNIGSTLGINEAHLPISEIK